MDVLPDFIESISATQPYPALRRMERVRPRQLSEWDWDCILRDHAPLLAEALQQAELIAQDSSLMFLGAQVDGVIDLLFAEVRQEDQEFRRLVLVEDKLLRSPEARREVLAQVLDYSRMLHESWSLASLRELQQKLPDHQQWLAQHEDELRQCCQQQDFLLVIAGDGIHDGLARLVRRFSGKSDPLSLAELALVSMGLYSDGTEYLLVPLVASAVERSQRELTVRVTVANAQGELVPAQVARHVQEGLEQVSRRRQPVRPEARQFLINVRARLDDELRGMLPELERTKTPNKHLGYRMPAPGGSGAWLMVLFGDTTTAESWSPIRVGLWFEGADPAERDRWRQRIEGVQASLPASMDVSQRGLLTFIIWSAFEYALDEDLNDLLIEEVVKTALQYVRVSLPLLQGQ